MKQELNKNGKRPAKRKTVAPQPEPFKAGVIRDVTREWLAKRENNKSESDE